MKKMKQTELNPPHIEPNLKLSKRRLQKVKKEFQQNEQFRRVYTANEKTGRLNQTLVCNICDAPFKKLCNMKDHVRMHQG